MIRVHKFGFCASLLAATIFCSLPGSIDAFDKLNNKFCIQFGQTSAPLKVVQYFSFACPHCVALFRDDFQKVKHDYIDSNQICYLFHPVPMDLVTVQAMDCFEKLSEREKIIFLDAIMSELDLGDPEVTTLLMKKAMELFGRPLPHLEEKEYISETDAFHAAFDFVKQKDRIEVVPSVELNGRYMEEEIPDLRFFNLLVKEHQPAGTNS